MALVARAAGSARCWPTRIVSWIRHYDWLAAAADPGLSGALRRCRSAASAPICARVARTGLVGHEAVLALKALIFADLAFLRDGKRYEKSLEQNAGAARQVREALRRA